MNAPHPRPDNDLTILQLLPNLITITAIAAGLTAIRFGIAGNYELSVLLILLAAVLDGVDGRLARLLKSDSKLGAELDSLGDFLNFGVSPALVIYFWGLQDMPSEGWVAVLVYAVCCVLRLARFNVSAKTNSENSSEGYFVGVPAPAGAMLVLLPMFISFTMSDRPVLPGWMISLYMIAIGLLLISRIPTPSFKTVKIARPKAKYYIVGFAFAGAAVLSHAWETLVVLTLAYVVLVVRSLYLLTRRRKSKAGEHGN
jgi:CDP-diacylglycerol---serine O-phosphatidyltransferase